MTAIPFFTQLPPGPSSTVQSSSQSTTVAAAKPKPTTVSFVMIDNYLIDVTLSEDHRFESDITEHPVESGASISDNIRPKPIMVTMEGLVSNTPLAEMAKIRNIRPPAENALSALGLSGAAGALNHASTGIKTSEEAYAHLLTIWERREPVTIRTSLGTFENMALESISFPRASGEADALRFSATFKQIKVVKNKRVKVAIPIATGGGGSGGKKKQKVAPPVVVDRKQVMYVNKSNMTWFDRDINGWRESATLQQPTIEFRGSARERVTNFVWVLSKGRPLVQVGSVTRAEWARWLRPPPAPESIPNFSGNPLVLPARSSQLEQDYSDPSIRTMNPGADHDLTAGGPWANIITVEVGQYKITTPTRSV